MNEALAYMAACNRLLLCLSALSVFSLSVQAQDDWWKMQDEKKPPTTASRKRENEPSPRTVDNNNSNVTESVLRERFKDFKNSRRFTAKYDKFEDRTRVAVGPFQLTGDWEVALAGSHVSIYAAFHFDGQTLSSPVKDFVIGFPSGGKGWQFLNARDVIFLVDGERMRIGEAARDSDVRLRGVKELLIVEIDSNTFRQIANGSTVEVKLGNRELKLKDEHLQAFKDLYSLAH